MATTITMLAPATIRTIAARDDDDGDAMQYAVVVIIMTQWLPNVAVMTPMAGIDGGSGDHAHHADHLILLHGDGMNNKWQ